MDEEQSKPLLDELAKLYPELSTEELKTAEENLRRFVEVAVRICEQAERSEGTDSPIVPLTDPPNRSTIRSKDKEK